MEEDSWQLSLIAPKSTDLFNILDLQTYISIDI